ncbi:MAG: Xylose isomerase protein barrel [Acidobacteriaceae bacterium]|nr:Xylose isomerase protein barrel [Acidobacteriaceae bacterium]
MKHASISRRSFVAGIGAAASLSQMPRALAMMASSKFHLAVISDEIAPDFDHSCSVAANDFGLGWVELRTIWGKNLVDADDATLAKAEQVLAKYKLRVTDIASPLFKVDFPGASKSKERTKEGNFGVKETAEPSSEAVFKKQDEVLEKCIALAKRFKTDRIRCFDFWRLDDQAPYRAAINAKLQAAAEVCAKNNLVLVLENEYACNTATGRESGKTLSGVKSKSFMLNWDPGNAVARGETDAFPGGWNAIPKDRIGHCHCKDAVRTNTPAGFEWRPVGDGIIDWVAQFKAFNQIGYSHAVSLETHWHGPQGPEASTRTSMAGLKKDLALAEA